MTLQKANIKERKFFRIPLATDIIVLINGVKSNLNYKFSMKSNPTRNETLIIFDDLISQYDLIEYHINK